MTTDAAISSRTKPQTETKNLRNTTTITLIILQLACSSSTSLPAAEHPRTHEPTPHQSMGTPPATELPRIHLSPPHLSTNLGRTPNIILSFYKSDMPLSDRPATEILESGKLWIVASTGDRVHLSVETTTDNNSPLHKFSVRPSSELPPGPFSVVLETTLASHFDTSTQQPVEGGVRLGNYDTNSNPSLIRAQSHHKQNSPQTSLALRFSEPVQITPGAQTLDTITAINSTGQAVRCYDAAENNTGPALRLDEGHPRRDWTMKCNTHLPLTRIFGTSAITAPQGSRKTSKERPNPAFAVTLSRDSEHSSSWHSR